MITYLIDFENKNLRGIMDTNWKVHTPKQKHLPNLEDEFSSIVKEKLGEIDEELKKFYPYVFNVWVANDKKLTDENFFSVICDYASDNKALTKTDKAIFINLPMADFMRFEHWANIIEIENRF